MKLEIKFFNIYKIKLDVDHWLDYNLINSFKLAKLLAYIIYHHHRKISSLDLQELMFNDGESNNPANALKTLIYRLRALLKSHLGEYDFILSSHGLYYWNPDIELVFDVDDFNNYCRLGRDKSYDVNVRAAYYQRAFDEYKGHFLPMLEEVKEFIVIRTHLNSQFLNASHYLLEYNINLKRYDIVEEICSATLAFNHDNETINLILIMSLVKQGKMTLANEHYHKVIIFFKENISEMTIRKMKYYLSLGSANTEEKNILAIQEDLVETNVAEAFSCDYDFFRKVYQLEARKAFRKGSNGVVVLFTIKPKQYVKNNPEVYNRVLEESSKILEKVILKLLRVGDIVCKYSHKQFLVLLDCNIDVVKKIIDRINEVFKTYDKYERVVLEYNYTEVILANVHCDQDNVLKIQ